MGTTNPGSSGLRSSAKRKWLLKPRHWQLRKKFEKQEGFGENIKKRRRKVKSSLFSFANKFLLPTKFRVKFQKTSF